MVKRTFVLVCLLLVACTPLTAGGPAAREITLTVLESGLHCGGPEQTARAEWIDQPGGLENLGTGTRIPQNAPDYQWDPDTEGALRLHMGTRPTGGYRIELAQPTARVEGQTAVVHVRWIEPAPGSFVTQALTSPCLLLKMPKDGIDRVAVRDQEDRPLFEVSVPE